MKYLRQVWAVIAKDMAAEMHTREILSAMAVFAVLALLIFSFTLDLRGSAGRAAAPGVLWATIAFAGTLGLSRSMAREQQTGGMEGLLLAPIERTAIFFGKAVGNLILMLLMEVVLLPLGTALLDAPLLRLPVLPVLVLGTAGYAVIGTLLAAIAGHTRAREVLLAILLLPLAVPLLLAAVRATEGIIAGVPFAEIAGWVRLLGAYDLIMIAIALVTFDAVVEE